MSTSSFHFRGPVRHENLEIHFLIGPSIPPDYLTLAEGCSQQIVEIFETGRVGHLAVWNKSTDRPLSPRHSHRAKKACPKLGD
ncbi:MAG TPA: hypothetical protein VF020_16840 [Chthoniobacterales bacterium]